MVSFSQACLLINGLPTPVELTELKDMAECDMRLLPSVTIMLVGEQGVRVAWYNLLTVSEGLGGQDILNPYELGDANDFESHGLDDTDNLDPDRGLDEADGLNELKLLKDISLDSDTVSG